MPKRGVLSKLLVNEFDFSSQSNSVEVDLSTQRIETTVLQSTGGETTATASTGSIAQNGYFLDKAAGMFEQELAAQIANGTTLYVAALFGTDVAACPSYVARQATAENMKIAAPVDGVLTMSGKWFEGQGIKRGLRAYEGVISATGAQAQIDLGAAGVAGGFAWLFVQDKTGTITGATITLETATVVGFTSPVTKGTFTFSALGGYEIALSGAMGRYARINCTGKGGATSFTVVAIVASSGVTY